MPQTNFEEDGGSSLAARIILGKPYQMDAFLWSKGMEAAKLERRERIVATSAEHDGRKGAVYDPCSCCRLKAAL